MTLQVFCQPIINYHEGRNMIDHPGDDTLLLSNILVILSNLQHVSHTFIPASYITEQQPASNVIVPGQLANNLPIPGQQLANHITVVAGQQPATASHIIASGQQAASHIIVPGRHPPIIGHKKRGHKRTIYHKCIISKHELNLERKNDLGKNLGTTYWFARIRELKPEMAIWTWKELRILLLKPKTRLTGSGFSFLFHIFFLPLTNTVFLVFAGKRELRPGTTMRA
ncbi:hypothetical protein C2G38_2036258 [Gigaspora rosea]|uniref:Uncharacterized protein n=1 Tax=Gigaspora rosea TaxID=44941 RepID=A0A397V9L0_9GLOM|nr:hypothetical protein C2G38_2036258 [Gigaspora rosea]